MKSSTFLALGLSTLTIAAPTPATSHTEEGERHISLYGFIFKIPRLPGSRITIGADKAHDGGIVTTDQTKEKPSLSTTGPFVTPSLPLPVPTTVLLAQSQQTGMPRIEETNEGVEELEVPDTVSATSYARIEAGLIELYPQETEEVPCERHWRMSKYRYDAAVVGLVFAFLLVLLAVEAWTAVCPCIRQALLCEGSIRLEGDAKPCSRPSFRADGSDCEKGTEASQTS